MKTMIAALTFTLTTFATTPPPADCQCPPGQVYSSNEETCTEPVVPIYCPRIYYPVCGCNGVTYANVCLAEKAGVIYYTPNPCAR